MATKSIKNVFFIIALSLATVNSWFALRVLGGWEGSLSTSDCHHGAPTKCNGNQTTYTKQLASFRPETYNFTVGICAIVKDGELYLTEWLDYHLVAMNIDAIYIYDNSLDFDLQRWYANTRMHNVYKRVEIRHLPDATRKRQRRAYTDCVNRYGKNITRMSLTYAKKEGWEVTDRQFAPTEGMDYLAMIDIDEFLVPKGRYTSIHGVIRDYLEPFTGGSLTINWMLFGSSNKTIYSPVPVTKRFQYRDETPHDVVKSIVKSSDYYSMKNPHSMNTIHGHTRTTLYKGAILHDGNVSKSSAVDPALPSQVILLHHYRYTSSKEYYYKKCIRRETDGSKGCSHQTGRTMTVEELKEKGKPTHIALRIGSVFDDSAWRIMMERIPKYRIFDDEMSWGDFS